MLTASSSGSAVEARVMKADQEGLAMIHCPYSHIVILESEDRSRRERQPTSRRPPLWADWTFGLLSIPFFPFFPLLTFS